MSARVDRQKKNKGPPNETDAWKKQSRRQTILLEGMQELTFSSLELALQSEVGKKSDIVSFERRQQNSPIIWLCGSDLPKENKHRVHK